MLTRLIVGAQNMPPILALLLMLRYTFELAKNAISKNQIIFKVYLEIILKFFLHYQIFGLRATLLLVPLLNYCPVKKRDSKKDLI